MVSYAFPVTKVAVIGDSISTGAHAKEPKKNGYPALLDELMGPEFDVKPFAAGGRTLLLGCKHPLMKEGVYQKALEFGPDIAIIMLGTNDTNPNQNNWSHRKDLEKDLMAMIGDLREVNPDVVIHISGPLDMFPEEAGLKPDRIENLKQRAQNLRTVWQTFERIAYREKRVFFHDLSRVLEAEDTTDGVHPDTEGHKKVAHHMHDLMSISFEEEFDILPALTEAVGKVNEVRFSGYPRYNFKIPGINAGGVVVAPRQAAEGHPWIWRARFFGHEPALDLQLLDRGWHVVYVDVANLYGNSQAMERWDQAYDLFTGNMELAPKVVLEGMSRGGLPIFNWAIKHPDRVAAIYADNPVCDFRTWPAGHNGGSKSGGDWKRLLDAWNLDESAAMNAEQIPDRLKPLAEAKVPVAIVLGMKDKVVPVEPNGELLAKRYSELGGPVKVWRKPDKGHHPHGLHPPDELRRYLMNAAGCATDKTE